LHQRVDTIESRAPGLPRRLAAAGYDCLILAALLVLADAVLVLPLQAGLGISAEAIGAHPLFRLYLLLVILGFFTWFWTHGGQTLGMRAWRLRLVRADGSPVDARRALLRLAAAALSWAALGAGFLWVLFDRDRLAWHDRISNTRLVVVAGPAR
jgi:uncharacterized RDD family membrane protein YckC